MCLQDLQIGRHKYTEYAPTKGEAVGPMRPGTVTNTTVPFIDHGEQTLFIGPNNTRTALRVVAPPIAIFNSEANKWVFSDTVVLGFPVPPGVTDVFAINTPIYPMFALSNTTKLFDTITLEMVGNLLYSAWAFIVLSDTTIDGFQSLTVWDIMADRKVMAAAMGESVDLG